jgi:hypothetical protein
MRFRILEHVTEVLVMEMDGWKRRYCGNFMLNVSEDAYR